ncbi:MAG: protease inhibitor I42 family protein [Patescibacteria group bacterium]
MDPRRISLDVTVGEYNGVCLPSNEGSTGYHWILPMMPNCINRTNDEWMPAFQTSPGYTGTPGVHVFVFQGMTPTQQPAEMEFLLVPPGRDQKPTQRAVCTVTVRK